MRESGRQLLHALALLALVACNRSSSSEAAAAPAATCSQTSSCAQECPTEKLADCVAGCAARLSARARPYWDALQTCSKPNCADSCTSPTALSCKLCVMRHCAPQATACLAN